MNNDLFRAKVRPLGLAIAAGSLACLCTLTGFAGPLWWAFDMTSHFRLQYAVGLSLIAGLLGFARKPGTTGVFLAFAAINWALVIHQCWFGRAQRSSAGKVLRVMEMNVHTENKRHDLAALCIREKDPDLVVLEEVNDQWLKDLDDLHSVYPYSLTQPQSDNFGIALFSKLPLQRAEIVYLGHAEVPSVIAQIEVTGRKITVLGTHPLPPASRENTSLRDEQLSAVASLLTERKGAAVVLGDLNTTPWSYSFRRVLRDARLTDSSRGFGYQASWPTAFLPLRVPIDHCLLSPDFKAVRREIGRAIGSDHFPLIVEIAVGD